MIYKNKHGNKIFKSRESTLLEVEYTNIQAGESRFLKTADPEKIIYLYQNKVGGTSTAFLSSTFSVVNFYSDGTGRQQYLDFLNNSVEQFFTWYVDGPPQQYPYTITSTNGTGTVTASSDYNTTVGYNTTVVFTITGADGGSVDWTINGGNT